MAITGSASAAATRAYIARHGGDFPAAHYSDFGASGIGLSSLGLGSFPGAASDAVDRGYADVVARAVAAGINVVDTATHYRYGRSPRAVGAGLRTAFAAGVARAAVFVVSKGGFLVFPDGPPSNFARWCEREVVARGFGSADEVAARVHLMTPAHLLHQLDLSRAWLGVDTLDAFLVDQPEVHIPAVGKAATLSRLSAAFVALEQGVQAGKLKYYGISSFYALRAHTDDPYYLSLASLLALAERAAQTVFGAGAAHHFALVQFPYNAVMPEAFTRFNQITGQGNEASVLQAALQLGLFTLASHSLFKGHLATRAGDSLHGVPGLASPAQRALQFSRSTPGLGAALVGISTPAHLADLLAVARTPPLARPAFLGLFRRAD